MRRTTNKIPSRDTFYIVTNGTATEKNYFTALKSKKSQYEVKILCNAVDPCKLVEYAAKFLDNANQVWVVFDVDYFHQENKVEPAILEAEQCGLKCAVSNIAFEAWLISHYEKISAPCTAKELQSKLCKRIGAKYYKNDDKLMKKLVNEYREAVKNSKVIFENRVKDYNQKHGAPAIYPIWDWNTCTTVYKLIEALQLKE